MSISVGIVGVGMFGPAFIQPFRDHPEVHRLALCDLNAERLADRAKRFEISETYASLDEICKTDIDALAIITQPWLHVRQCVQAMEAGKNVFSSEVALFKMSNGAAVRICEFRRIGYPGCERVSGLYGTEASFEQNLAGSVWATKSGWERVELDRHHEPLPEALAANLGGHGGSHAYLAHEFVDSVNRQRLPRINVWQAVRYCAPGFVAHQSALKGGELLKVPDWGDPPE